MIICPNNESLKAFCLFTRYFYSRLFTLAKYVANKLNVRKVPTTLKQKQKKQVDRLTVRLCTNPFRKLDANVHAHSNWAIARVPHIHIDLCICIYVNLSMCVGTCASAAKSIS